MTQEEKAKAYDEALRKIWPLYEHAKKEDCPIWSTYEYIFPELSESEEDRIIKTLQEYVKNRNWILNGPTMDEVLAWLEKQKAKEKYDRMTPIYDKQEEFESALDKAWKFYNESGSRTVDGCEDNYPELIFSKGFREGFLFWTEKQKELGPLTKEEEYILHCIIEYLEDETCPSDWISLLHDIYCLPYEKQKEQKPAEWSGEDNICWDEAFACVTRAKKTAKNEEELQSAVTAEKWLKEIQFKYYVYPANQEWSEEDERMLSRCVKSIESSKQFADSDTFKKAKDNEIDWLLYRLKILKPQSKQEWSNEDEKLIDNVINSLCCYQNTLSDYYQKEIVGGEIRKLKSLHPSWKPCKEQMKALQCAIAFMEIHKASDYDITPLKSLYEQLKKSR